MVINNFEKLPKINIPIINYGLVSTNQPLASTNQPLVSTNINNIIVTLDNLDDYIYEIFKNNFCPDYNSNNPTVIIDSKESLIFKTYNELYIYIKNNLEYNGTHYKFKIIKDYYTVIIIMSQLNLIIDTIYKYYIK